MTEKIEVSSSEKIINLETETNNNKHESEIDSDQIDDDDETSNKVINMILIFSILKLLLFF